MVSNSPKSPVLRHSELVIVGVTMVPGISWKVCQDSPMVSQTLEVDNGTVLLQLSKCRKESLLAVRNSQRRRNVRAGKPSFGKWIPERPG